MLASIIHQIIANLFPQTTTVIDIMVPPPNQNADYCINIAPLSRNL